MHRSSLRWSARLLAWWVLALSVAACSDRSGSPVGDAGGTMVIAVGGGDVSSLLPPFAIDAVGRAVSDQLFERLAEIGNDLNTLGDRGFQPRLATSWDWAKDSLSIAFHIEPRARWHDGRPVRASDVRYTFAVLKDPKTATQNTATIANVDSVTVRDSLTAVAWFHRRTPEQFYDFVYQVSILPEHLLKDVAHDKLATSDFARAPIGSGRFRFVRLEPGVRIEVVADTAHYRGRPKLDRLVWSFASDPGASITKLLSGQADLYENIPYTVVARVDSTGIVRAVRYPGLGYAYMGMNQRDPKRVTSPHPIFGDVRVRRAIFMGLDRRAMLRNVFDTLGVLGVGPYPRALADTTVVLPPFDRPHALALLDSAGWRAGADGIRQKNGLPFAFTLLVPTSSQSRMRYSVLIQEQLKALGARVGIEAIDIGAFIDRQDAHTFDVALHSAGTDPSRASIKQNWTSEGIAKGGGNWDSYSNRSVESLLDSALTTFDPDKTRQYYHRAVQQIVDDAPAVWLYDVLPIAGVHKRLRPAPMRADAWWAHLADWSIPANERIERDRIGLRPATP
jgi:peptide/nickel transport system substrate-binding protein